MEQKQRNLFRKRGIYLLPNLLTTGGLFAGFYAIVAGMNGMFEVAAIAIFVAMIADALDGRVARLTNTQTEFGVQYDSLSDMVSFGLAPALVVYKYALIDLGKLGWLIAFSFAAAGALRLARFNTQVNHQDKGYFQGLSITAAGGFMASLIWLGPIDADLDRAYHILIAVITFVIAALMISNVRYHSFKDINFKGRVRFITLVIFTLLLMLISINPPLVLFLVFLCYVLSGPFMTLVHLRKTRLGRLRRKEKTQNSLK